MVILYYLFISRHFVTSARVFDQPVSTIFDDVDDDDDDDDVDVDVDVDVDDDDDQAIRLKVTQVESVLCY